MSKNIFEFLSFNNKIIVIGSSANKQLKYVTDYDTQENIEKLDKYKLLIMFQEKYKFAKQNDHIYIIDFKAGMYNNVIPVRWDYNSILKGYQYIDDTKIRFIDCLNNNDNNTVKIDLIVFDNDIFHEYSCNYYFGNSFIPDEELYNSLLVDVEKYFFDEKYMKMLKRMYSYLKKNKSKKISKFITFFNSEAGLYNQLEHQTNVIIDVIGNEFRPVKPTQLTSAIKTLKHNTPQPFKHLVTKSSLKELSEQLHIQVNNNVINFIEKL